MSQGSSTATSSSLRDKLMKTFHADKSQGLLHNNQALVSNRTQMALLYQLEQKKVTKLEEENRALLERIYSLTTAQDEERIRLLAADRTKRKLTQLRSIAKRTIASLESGLREFAVFVEDIDEAIGEEVQKEGAMEGDAVSMGGGMIKPDLLLPKFDPKLQRIPESPMLRSSLSLPPITAVAGEVVSDRTYVIAATAAADKEEEEASTRADRSFDTQYMGGGWESIAAAAKDGEAESFLTDGKMASPQMASTPYISGGGGGKREGRPVPPPAWSSGRKKPVGSVRIHENVVGAAEGKVSDAFVTTRCRSRATSRMDNTPEKQEQKEEERTLLAKTPKTPFNSLSNTATTINHAADSSGSGRSIKRSSSAVDDGMVTAIPISIPTANDATTTTTLGGSGAPSSFGESSIDPTTGTGTIGRQKRGAAQKIGSYKLPSLNTKMRRLE